MNKYAARFIRIFHASAGLDSEVESVINELDKEGYDLFRVEALESLSPPCLLVIGKRRES